MGSVTMKVLFIHDSFAAKSGGFYNSTFHLFLRGFSCDVFLSAPSEGKIDGRKETTVDKITVWLRPGYRRAINFYFKGPGFWYSVYRAFRNQFIDVDVIVVCGPCSSAILAYLAAKKMNKPIIAYFIGDPRKVVKHSYKNARWIVRLLARMAAAWEWLVMRHIASSYAAVALGEEIYQEIKPYARKIIKGATSLVAKSDIYPPKSDLSLNPLKILTVSRLSSEKGLDIAIDAIVMLLKKGIDVQYHIIGDGPFRGQLEKKIRACGLEQYVRLFGKIPYDELKHKYREYDLFLLPSRSEGVPKVLFEAMAAGIPIIATDVGGARDVLGGGKRGWLCKAGDPQSLVMRICDCLNDEQLRKTKLKNAYEYIQDHTREAQARRLVEFIQESFF